MGQTILLTNTIIMDFDVMTLIVGKSIFIEFYLQDAV